MRAAGPLTDSDRASVRRAIGVGTLHWKSATSSACPKEGRRGGRTRRVMLVGVLRRRDKVKRRALFLSEYLCRGARCLACESWLGPVRVHALRRQGAGRCSGCVTLYQIGVEPHAASVPSCPSRALGVHRFRCPGCEIRLDSSRDTEEASRTRALSSVLKLAPWYGDVATARASALCAPSALRSTARMRPTSSVLRRFHFYRRFASVRVFCGVRERAESAVRDGAQFELCFTASTKRG